MGFAQQPASAQIGGGDADTSPITRASGKKKTALAGHVHNDRLVDAVHRQGFCALIASPTARNYTAEATATAARQLASALMSPGQAGFPPGRRRPTR